MIMQSSRVKFHIWYFYMIIIGLWNIYGKDPHFKIYRYVLIITCIDFL